MKESEKTKKYLYLASELKKLWNMKVTVISTVLGARGTVPKDFEKTNKLGELEIRRRAETKQTTELFI